MRDVRKKLAVIAVLFALFGAANVGILYGAYEGNQKESHMTYEEALRMTEKDCCR